MHPSQTLSVIRRLARLCGTLAILLCGLAPALHAQVPQIINYQGRVAVGSPAVNFNGSGQFKFALVNTNGSTTYWSNDGTSTAGSQPTAAVTLTVTNGLYSVLLGDTTVTNMTAVPNSVFANSDVRLRVWFNDGPHGSQLLTPDQRLAAVGYAMMATNFSGSLGGDVTGTQGTTSVVGIRGIPVSSTPATSGQVLVYDGSSSQWTPSSTIALGGNFSAGTVTATTFSGSGAGLTNIPASALASTPPGMVLIPAGTFMMGDNLDGEGDATPTVATTVSAFYMDANLVTYSQWQSVYNWATSNGYTDLAAGAGKTANHPVQTVNWYDCVKWCNARSQQAGKAPTYYTDAGLTAVYKTGTGPVYVDWVVSGYRLPTEAEWEKAARGGRSNQRFPFGNTISEMQANYYSDTVNLPYDLGPSGYNAAYATGAFPYTSPVGSFAANGYGLYDMVGNVFEWCWDWYPSPFTPYAGGTDPHGPASGSYRVLRGGNWFYDVYSARCANRVDFTPTYADYGIGFRAVLPPGQ